MGHAKDRKAVLNELQLTVETAKFMALKEPAEVLNTQESRRTYWATRLSVRFVAYPAQ